MMEQTEKIDWKKMKVEFRWKKNSIDDLLLQEKIIGFHNGISPVQIPLSALQRKIYSIGLKTYYQTLAEDQRFAKAFLEKQKGEKK